MVGQLFTAKAKSDYALNDKRQFKIHAGKEYLYHKSFGAYVVQFGRDEVLLSEKFFKEHFFY